jgi:hypothetical protein
MKTWQQVLADKDAEYKRKRADEDAIHADSMSFMEKALRTGLIDGYPVDPTYVPPKRRTIICAHHGTGAHHEVGDGQLERFQLYRRHEQLMRSALFGGDIFKVALWLAEEVTEHVLDFGTYIGDQAEAAYQRIQARRRHRRDMKKANTPTTF